MQQALMGGREGGSEEPKKQKEEGEMGNLQEPPRRVGADIERCSKGG